MLVPTRSVQESVMMASVYIFTRLVMLVTPSGSGSRVSGCGRLSQAIPWISAKGGDNKLRRPLYLDLPCLPVCLNCKLLPLLLEGWCGSRKAEVCTVAHLGQVRVFTKRWHEDGLSLTMPLFGFGSTMFLHLIIYIFSSRL